MKIIFLIVIVSSNIQSFVAEWDRLIVYEGGGILMDNTTTGFSSVKQRAESIFCGTGQSQGCLLNDKCCKCATGSCDTDKIAEDLTVMLEKLSTSSAAHVGQVAATLHDSTVDIRDFFTKTNQTLSRDKLQRHIVTTFKSIVKIPFLSSIDDVTNRIVDTLHLIKTDLKDITEAANIETKNSAARDLGQHVIILADITSKLAKVISGVCNLQDSLLEETYTVILVTTVAFFFVGQTLMINAKQVNKVGFRNDTASDICMHVSLALQQYVLVIQLLSECPNIESLKERLPGVQSSLCKISDELRGGIISAIGEGYNAKSQSLFGIVDDITDCVRDNKLLQESESAINETIVSLFDVSDAILAGRLSCFCINAFDKTVSIQLRNVLVHLHAVFFFIANIPDDSFSSGDKLGMLLATMNAIVDKIMCGIAGVMQSILSLGDITEGGSSLIHVFEAVVTVAISVVSSVALIFTELKDGSHSVDLSKSMPHIMLITKYQIVAAGDRIKQISEDCGKDHDKYQIDTFIDMSLMIQSYNEFKNDVADAVAKFHCSEGKTATGVGDVNSKNVDGFIGKIKASTQRFSQRSGFGQATAVAVNDILGEVYDTLNRLSTISLGKGNVLKLVCLTISNYYFAFVTLNSIFNSSRYGTNASVF
ncbi:uncharacterized protein LOC119082057 [Bradysia coprophila]|uniref:uncharacterized protein LOC119082057 n=1 Tax=Bradysia coprophila TaxID=38358 RepID=UPI00187D6F72|nr:uncharacterized protein LOC119082057 [Bradysia coprophila]